MQKVIVQIDWYTKVILTLIAVFLAGIFARSYFSSDISRAKAGDIILEVINPYDPFGVGEKFAKGVQLTEEGQLRQKVRQEGSSFLVENLYLWVLQDLSPERALEIIEDCPVLSNFPAGKGYAQSLITLEKGEAQRGISDEIIRTALLSGRFEVTPYGIVRIPLEVKVVNFPWTQTVEGTVKIRQSRTSPIYVENVGSINVEGQVSIDDYPNPIRVQVIKFP